PRFAVGPASGPRFVGPVCGPRFIVGADPLRAFTLSPLCGGRGTVRCGVAIRPAPGFSTPRGSSRPPLFPILATGPPLPAIEGLPIRDTPGRAAIRGDGATAGRPALIPSRLVRVG